MVTLTKTQQQIALLGQLLKTEGGREKLVASLVTAMKKRKRVNITVTSKKVAEQIGEEAAIYAEQCLMAAAKEAAIFLMDGKESIRGICFKRNDKWFVRRNDEEFPVCVGDFLTCYAPDGSSYWQGIVDVHTPDEETDRPFTLGWNAELVKE